MAAPPTCEPVRHARLSRLGACLTGRPRPIWLRRAARASQGRTTVGESLMPYAIITRDKPNSLQLRNDTREPHLEYLSANQDKLLAAGAQTDDAGQGGYGGIIIVDTEDRAEAEAFIRNDPFTKAGLFAGIEVVRWRKAFFNKERLV
jgi:uncharacterized protein